MTSVFLAALLALAGAAQALEPGDGVVVHFRDGTAISGVLVSLSASQVVVDVGGAQAGWPMNQVSAVQAEQTDVETFQEMLKAAGDDPVKLQQAARQARSHQVTNPVSNFQFNLQQFIDRQGAGLPPAPR